MCLPKLHLTFALRLNCCYCWTTRGFFYAFFLSKCKTAHIIEVVGIQWIQTCRNMVRKVTTPITANSIQKNDDFSRIISLSFSLKTWNSQKVTLSGQMLKTAKESKRNWVTHHNDLGEDDAEHWLHRTVDHGADGSYQNIRPLRNVVTHHFKERHGRSVLILQKDYWKLCYTLGKSTSNNTCTTKRSLNVWKV